MKLPEEFKFITNAHLPQHSTEQRLDQKICVITGATSGIGLVTAQKLASQGAQLIVIYRNPQKFSSLRAQLQNQSNTIIDGFQADFSNLSQVKQAANNIAEKYPSIDRLINCAGIFHTKRTLTPEGNEMVFTVNHLSSFLLTRILLPNLINAAPSRILQINSQGHRFGGLNIENLTFENRFYHGLLSYGASKVAQILTVQKFNHYLADKNVTINAMHPGAVKSNIGMNNGFFYTTYQKLIVRTFLKDPHISADAIHYLLAAPELENTSGKFFNLTIEETPARYTGALDADLADKIWRKSEQLTGLDHLEI